MKRTNTYDCKHKYFKNELGQAECKTCGILKSTIEAEFIEKDIRGNVYKVSSPQVPEWKKRFRKLWKRIEKSRKGHFSGRIIWSVDESDEDSYKFVDETLEQFISEEVQDAYDRGSEEATTVCNEVMKKELSKKDKYYKEVLDKWMEDRKFDEKDIKQEAEKEVREEVIEWIKKQDWECFEQTTITNDIINFLKK